MRSPENITVIGCGTMGHSIALNTAWAGLEIRMYGLNATEIEKGMSGIAAKLDIMRKGGLIGQTEIPSLLERIITTTSLDQAVEGASFVIEAIPEELSLKHQLFKQLEAKCSRETILASNTSGLMPSHLAEALTFRQRFIVLHFWNPAHLVPLVEVIRAEETDSETEQRAMDLLYAMRKKPVVLRKEIKGFIGNRLQFALFREAQYLLELGIASKEDIDAAVTYGIGRRLPVTGPLASADMGGLDVFATISNYLFADLSQAKEALPVLTGLLAENKLGQKSGEGFYKWDEQHSALMNKKREAELIRFMKQDMEADGNE